MVEHPRADPPSEMSHDRFLAELERALQPLEDPEIIMATVCRRLGEHLAVDRCAYAVAEDDGVHFTMTGSYGDGPPLTGRFAYSQFGAAFERSMREGDTLAIADCADDSRIEPADRQVYQQIGTAAVIAVPLRKVGATVAGMAVQHGSVRPWSSGDIELVETVVGRCWESLQRAHAIVALRESEQRSRLLVERASDGIWLVDDEMRYIDANPVACAMLGYTREEHRRLSIPDVVDAGDMTRLSSVIGRMRAGESIRQAWNLRRKDGSWVPVELSIGAAGLGRFQAIGRDITDRLRIETERERLLAREQAARRAAEQFGAVVAELSRATTQDQVVDVALEYGARLGAAGVTVELPHRGGLRRAGSRGRVPDGAPDSIAPDSIAPDASPLLHALETAEPVWAGRPVAVPLLLAGRAVGVIGLWHDAGEIAGEIAGEVGGGEVGGGATGGAIGGVGLGEDQRAGLLMAAGLCAQALDRARLYEAEHEVAQVLQRSLLPRALPELSRLAATARYRPAALHTSSGGDWYDLLPLSETTVALVVGDVVGHGPPAAAVMGQLRSALASLLLDGHGPAAALERLDRFATRVDGAQGSTCACMILDCSTGELHWALAGHPPPLLVDGGGARFVVGGGGAVLGVPGRGRYAQGHASIRPGTSVVLYSDGLVERREEVIDVGLERLATAAAGYAEHGPAELADLLLAATFDAAEPPDDVALLVVRVIPPPLIGTLPATARSTRTLRSSAAEWLSLAGVAEEHAQDLQLALGETAANAVEHAYPPGSDGEFEYHLSRVADGALRVRLGDRGRWRPVPTDNGFRGHGLRVIGKIGRDMIVNGSESGTEVTFDIPAAPPQMPAHPATASGSRPAGEPVVLREEPGALVIEGDLDLDGVATLAPTLLAAADRPGPLVVDLTGVGYVCSAAVALLATTAGGGRDLSYRVAAGSAPERMLDLTGLAASVVVTTVPDPSAG